jgi:ABC-type transport system substrate-binding protein
VTGVGNWNNYTNPELDKLIDSQSVEFDEPKRIETILEAQRIALAEHGPQITMPSGNFYAARWNHVYYPFEFGVDPGEGAVADTEIGPESVDIYVDEGTA